MAAVLETHDLIRDIAGRHIVDRVSLAVDRGEILAIMGPSGSGKSSLLRLLNRLDEPTGGTVIFDGKDTQSIHPQELRRRVGMVLQTPYLFPGTVADNIVFGPRQRGAELSAQAVEELLGHVRLPGYAERDAGRLSGGEAQRVSVARTLANEPEVLLLDEPTSALDADSKADVERLVVEIVRARNLACVLVTHDPGQARRMASRLLLLRDGKLERLGTPDEILNIPNAAALLGASPSPASREGA